MGNRIWLCVIGALQAFYLPGMAPVSYCEQVQVSQIFERIEISDFFATSDQRTIPWINAFQKFKCLSIVWLVQTQPFHSNIMLSISARVSLYRSYQKFSTLFQMKQTPHQLRTLAKSFLASVFDRRPTIFSLTKMKLVKKFAQRPTRKTLTKWSFWSMEWCSR